MPFDRPVTSPCVGVCALDVQDICMGCQRSAAEISAWGRMPPEEQLLALARCYQRAVKAGLMISINQY